MLVVGDSLEVGTEPYLRQELPGAELTVDALKGRPSSAGVDVLAGALQPQHEIVVFDLGTNDDPGNPEGLAASLQAAREIAGDRCMVVATINRPPLNGVTDAGLNGAISTFAAGPDVEVADWRSAANGAGILQPDGVHGTPQGYALRGKLVADAILSCAATPLPTRPARPDLGGRPQISDLPDPKPLGPGLGLLGAPVAAVWGGIKHLFAFAIAPVAALADVTKTAREVGKGLLERIGKSP